MSVVRYVYIVLCYGGTVSAVFTDHSSQGLGLGFRVYGIGYKGETHKECEGGYDICMF